jgi:hypothetical protein
MTFVAWNHRGLHRIAESRRAGICGESNVHFCFFGVTSAVDWLDEPIGDTGFSYLLEQETLS